RNLRLAAPLARRLGGDDVHRARQGVAAVKRALRTAQHFHALDVGHVEEAALRLAEIHAVQIQADGRLPGHRRVQRGGAANGNLGHGGVGRAALDLHVRREGAKLVKRGDVAALQKLLADGGNRDGNILQVLLATLGGDDDIAQAVSAIRNRRAFLLCESLRGRQGDNRCANERQKTRTTAARQRNQAHFLLPNAGRRIREGPGLSPSSGFFSALPAKQPNALKL